MQLMALLYFLCTLELSSVLKRKGMCALGGSPGPHADVGLPGVAYHEHQEPQEKDEIVRVKNWIGPRAELVNMDPCSSPNTGWLLEGTLTSVCLWVLQLLSEFGFD